MIVTFVYSRVTYNWNAEQDALLLEAEALGIDLSGVIAA